MYFIQIPKERPIVLTIQFGNNYLSEILLKEPLD
jgi:hypothetical protein